MYYEHEDQEEKPLRSAEHKKKIKDFLENTKDEQGGDFHPLTLKAPRKICHSYWGQAWCQYVANYDDYGYRLAPGRAYLRVGAVVDLKVERHCVKAKVLGHRLYDVSIVFKPLDEEVWEELRSKTSSSLSSVVDLLEGKIPEGLSQSLLSQEQGLFPSYSEIRFSCTCLDDANLCKHVGAVMYGVGVRFDEDPHLFFHLRGVNARDLITKEQEDPTKEETTFTQDRELQDIFDIELESF